MWAKLYGVIDQSYTRNIRQRLYVQNAHIKKLKGSFPFKELTQIMREDTLENILLTGI